MEDEEHNDQENERSHENEEYLLLSSNDWDLNRKQAHHFDEDFAYVFSTMVTWVDQKTESLTAKSQLQSFFNASMIQCQDFRQSKKSFCRILRLELLLNLQTAKQSLNFENRCD